MFRRPLAAAVASLLLVSGAVASADPVPKELRPDRLEAAPRRLQGVDLHEHLNGQLPLEAPFFDEAGQPVHLGDFFDGKHPVIVTLNYSHCPMLCSLQLNALVKAMKGVELSAGADYQVVTISLDPLDTPQTMTRMKARYLGEYARPAAERGWHFLHGSERDIHSVADAIGFAYSYNEARKEYVHPAAITIGTPDARISRYLYGIEYLPKTLRLSLVESSEGKIGSTVDRLVLFCFHYDETEGRYAPVAQNIMRLGGALTVVVLGGLLTSFWLAEGRKNKKRRLTESTAS